MFELLSFTPLLPAAHLTRDVFDLQKSALRYLPLPLRLRFATAAGG